MPFPSKMAKRNRYYLLNLEKAVSNRKVNCAKNRETVKASSSTSYRKEMCLVNKDKETAAYYLLEP